MPLGIPRKSALKLQNPTSLAIGFCVVRNFSFLLVLLQFIAARCSESVQMNFKAQLELHSFPFRVNPTLAPAHMGCLCRGSGASFCWSALLWIPRCSLAFSMRLLGVLFVLTRPVQLRVETLPLRRTRVPKQNLIPQEKQNIMTVSW